MIAFPCSSCQQKLSVHEDLAGKKVKCPGCAQVLLVPSKVDTPTLAVAAPLAKDPDSPTPNHDAGLTDFLAPPQAADELGRLGGFRILKVLGHGGMGVVFLGEDPKLGRKVAIKAMLPYLAGSKTSQQRFLREARAAATMEHDHIVPIFHVGEDHGAPFIVMPILKGEPLDQRLRRDGKLPIGEVLRLGREIAEGLGAAHALGLIHRDVKPGNIWLEAPHQRVKLLDFGLARAAADDAQLTQSGAIVGSPAYMAPEQGRGETIDARCDLWSLGVVLYRLCTGQLPFRGTDTISTLMAVARDDPPAPAQRNPDVPASLSDLVMKLLEKEPARRFSSAQEVVAALRALEQSRAPTQVLADPMHSIPVSVVPGTAANPGLRTRGRKPLLLALGGLVAALVAISVLFWPRPQGSGNNDPRTKGPPDGLVKAPPQGPLPGQDTNSLGMKFVRLPMGTFYMGGGGSKIGTKMFIAEDFEIAVYPVTQAQWQALMNGNPSAFSRNGPSAKAVADISDADLQQFPVENVPWEMVQLFIDQLNKQERNRGYVYRLPTEAEWEYACRGGGPSEKECSYHFYFAQPTNYLSSEQANFNGNFPDGKAPKGKYLERPTRVDAYPPNKLGLCDMHGNVRQWCADSMGSGVIRGGCWRDSGAGCRAARRSGEVSPTYRSGILSFRLARVPVGVMASPEGPLPAPATNSLSVKFVRLPKGTFYLGGGGGKAGTKTEIKEDFEIAVHPVTQAQWQALMNGNPSAFSRNGPSAKAVADISDADLQQFPVEMVSWEMAQVFIDQLNKQERNRGYFYRLPTEAEWEYACRGGATSEEECAYHFYFDRPTNDLSSDQANFIGNEPFGKAPKGKFLQRPTKMGSYPPNKLGLHDMHGNVWQWCADLLPGGSDRVIRGGSWNYHESGCRATSRIQHAGTSRHFNLGFRLARVPVGKKG